MDDEGCPATRGRPAHSSPNPEMVEGGSVGGRPMVGDEGRHSAGGGGFTAACERLPALRVRPVDRSLAQESGSGRCYCRPICRRSGGGLREPGGGGAISGRIPEASVEVRPGIACGEDAADRVWTVRRPKPRAAGRGKAGDFHVSGLPALLWEAPERWSVHRMARDGEEAAGGQLQAIKTELKRRRPEPVVSVGAWLQKVTSGYYQYHAVPGNLPRLQLFRWPCRVVASTLDSKASVGVNGLRLEAEMAHDRYPALSHSLN